MVVASSSSSKKKKKVSDKRKASLKAKKKVSKTEKKVAKSGKCFHCGKEGHWKRNYKEYLDSVKPKEGMVLVFEISLVEKSNKFWILEPLRIFTLLCRDFRLKGSFMKGKSSSE